MQSSSSFHELPKEQIEKAYPRFQLPTEETKHLTKLEVIVFKLMCVEFLRSSAAYII